MNPTDFDAALHAARRARARGADDLWALYVSLCDEYDGDELMTKLDAYKDDASADARRLYMSLVRA